MLRGMTARSDAPVSAPGTAPAPVSVIVGEEELLVERTVSALVAAGRLALAVEAGLASPDGQTDLSDPATAPGDIHDVAARDLSAGELAALTSPSLFGGGGVVVIRSAQDAGKEVADEIVRYAADPAPDMVLIVTHAGGAKGKALLTSLTKGRKAGVMTVIECPKITRFSDRLDFARAEFRRAGRVADEGGLRALLDAVGSDLREIAAACSQLAADVEGHIGEEAVARYYHGRAEASGFTVSDRTVEGRLADALEQLRWALATGVPPVLITSALAQGVRLLGRVGAAPRGKNSAALAAEVGAPPWKIDRVRQQLRGWAPEGVAQALQVVAEADAQIKGEAASPAFALERAVRRIVACRN
jgi:DNA polymerase III subunit delta